MYAVGIGGGDAMSSECRCHTDTNFCFYCEMYSPLERKYEEQTMAIEDVVSKLERSMRVSMNLKKHDKADAYSAAIYLLKEVLAQRETDNSNRANGNGTDDRGDGQTNQVETVRPGR